MSFKVNRELAKKRMDICVGCDKLFAPTKTCKECGCFMAAKVWLAGVECPLGKWGKFFEEENAQSIPKPETGYWQWDEETISWIERTPIPPSTPTPPTE